jgi:phosphoglycerate dehydrogenase-like enzyme
MKILVSEKVAKVGIDRLRDVHEVDTYSYLTHEELVKIIPNYDALIVRGETIVDSEVIEAAKNLKVIGRAGLEVDHIDIQAATRKGIIVLNAPQGNSTSSIEYTLGMILALSREIPQAYYSVKNGRWDRQRFIGTEVRDKVLGILGLGRVGSGVARRAKAFAMKVLAFDPFISEEKAAEVGVELVDFELLLSKADYLTLHLPTTVDTRNLLNKEAFSRMKKGVRIINCAKSGIIDEKALIWALEEGIVAGAALDNFEQEPLDIVSPLLKMDNVICTPRLASRSIEAEKYQITLVAVSTIINIPGLQHLLPYNPAEADSIADRLIELGIDNFQKRRSQITPKIPNKIQKAIAGFSTEAVLKALGNKLDPLVEVLTAGKIKGVVALVNCTTLRNGPHDWNTVNLTKELIKRDILVVSAGCGNHGLEVAGLCNLEAVEQAGEGLKEICKALGIPPVLSFGTCTDTGRISMLVTALANHLDLDIPELPIAVTAPEWMEQKATIDGIFALAYGTYTHLSPTPFVTGAPKLVKLLTEEVEKLTGGKIALGDDPQQVAEDIEKHIIAKRQALGLK